MYGRTRPDQQWRDVLGVLAVWRGRLDEAYLDQWATALGVSDLLERARRAIAELCSCVAPIAGSDAASGERRSPSLTEPRAECISDCHRDQ